MRPGTSIEEHFALIRLLKGQKQACQCCLAAARSTDEAKCFPGKKCDVDIDDDKPAAKRFCEGFGLKRYSVALQRLSRRGIGSIRLKRQQPSLCLNGGNRRQ